MPPFIENLGVGPTTWIVIAFVAAYCAATFVMLRKNPKFLWIPTLVILILATLFYYQVYDYAVAKSWFPKLVMALMSAIDLFLFRMASGLGNLSGFFYLKGGVALEGVGNPQIHLIILQGLYLCAVWTTCILIVHFLAGRLVSKAWLLFHSGRARRGRTHVFFGTNPQAVALAKSIPAGERILFVDGPSHSPFPEKVSILTLFQGVRNTSSTREKLRTEVPGSVFLKARQNTGKNAGESLFEELGLKRLARWAENADNCFYLLSDDQEENLADLRKMQPAKAQIYYRADREGAALKTVLASPDNIHIVDSSFLATKALRADASLYPVRLVDIAKDADGEPMGYVESPFHALVCGFGESGQGALSFLYEFGSFVGKDGKASPFQCIVLDKDMDRLAAGFKAARPALDGKRVQFLPCDTASARFQEILKEQIGRLNYVFISVGDDARNADLAVETLKYAFKYRSSLDGFLIVVKLDRPAEYRDMIRFFNDSYGGKDCLRTIGDIDRTWTWDNISGEGYLRYAQCFQAAYATTADEPVSWEQRNARIRQKSGSELSHRLEIRRKTEQDFANFFHVRVKAALCPERLWKERMADDIPVQYEGKHYVGQDTRAASVMDYLARLEHLRWNASHEMAGYVYAEEKREDLMTHPDMRPYASLDERTRHFDWIVVKTTLNLLESRDRPQDGGQKEQQA